MNINYKQSQFELFPGAPGSSSEASRPRYLLTYLTLSLENTVVLAIMMVMAVVFAFSLGVEKGKTITKSWSPPVPSGMAEVRGSQNDNLGQTNAPVSAATSKKPIKEKKAVPDSPPALSPSYTIQVASFKDETYAKKEASVLKMKGFDAFVALKGDYSIVCVGKFRKKDETNLFMPRLKKKYEDCLVRRL